MQDDFFIIIILTPSKYDEKKDNKEKKKAKITKKAEEHAELMRAAAVPAPEALSRFYERQGPQAQVLPVRTITYQDKTEPKYTFVSNDVTKSLEKYGAVHGTSAVMFGDKANTKMRKII